MFDLTWGPQWRSKSVQRSSLELRTWWSCSRQQGPRWRSKQGPNSI